MFSPQRRSAAVVAAALVLCSLFVWLNKSYPKGFLSDPVVPYPSEKPPDDEDKNVEKANVQLGIPPEYDSMRPEAEYCETRFSTKFLELLKNRTQQYCTEESRSRLNCFHVYTNPEGHADSFCIGRGATLDSESRKFSMDCQIRTFDADEQAAGAVMFDRIMKYWYDTGPRYIFDKFIDLGTSDKVQSTPFPDPVAGRPNFTLLVKREGDTNTWHSLMEIMTMMLSFDVLRMAADPFRHGYAYFSYPEDMANTQVVVLDDIGEGPYFDLWRMFSEKPILRLHEFAAQSALQPAMLDYIIVPMAGAANPQWQNDWTIAPCASGQLLHTFATRVLTFYGVLADGQTPDADSSITVTFIDRKRRRLVNQDALLESARAKLGEHVIIQAVDLATLPFVDQLRMIRDTDVLVGVHGAGLTHEMFLRKGSAVVEILPPDLTHKGFRNMANMLSLDYFSLHGIKPSEKAERSEKAKRRKDVKAAGVQDEEGKVNMSKEERLFITRAPRAPFERTVSYPGVAKRGWHDDDVDLEEERFLDVLDVAIKSLYNKGLRNFDVD